jgi:predicted TIM-barrel fold metal-dependent hydrolase
LGQEGDTVSEDRIVIVSSDCHSGVPFEQYREYLDPAYHTDFDDYEASRSAWWSTASPFADAAMEDREVVARTNRFTDSAGRVQDLEDNGVVAEVLFPGASPQTSVPWSDFLSSGAFRARTPRQRELQTAGERAYNRWLAEFCAETPNRRAGLGFAAIQDVDEAVRDIHWAADHGLKGILFPVFNYDIPEYCFGSYWDPIWAAMEERRLSVNIHGGYGLPEYGVHQTFPGLEFLFFTQRMIWQMMISGVFDRFADLRFAVTEASAMWVPETMARLDSVWDAQQATAAQRAVLFEDNQVCERRPSEYWRNNGFVGASLLSFTEMSNRDAIGVDTMMYGNDYPHPEGTWGRQISWLQATLGKAGGTEEDVRKILGRNACRLYDFDEAALQPIANQCGPSVSDVLHDLTETEISNLVNETLDMGRIQTANYLRQGFSRNPEPAKA